METRIPVDMASEDPTVRRARMMAAIRRYRPMSVWGQLVVLMFMATMIMLIASIGELRHTPSAVLPLSGVLLIALFFVAASAMRTQRQLSALVEVVMQGLEKP